MQKRKSAVEPQLAWPRDGWWRFILAGAAALSLGLGGLAAVYFLGRPLALLLLGSVVAAGLAPAVDWLDRHLPRPLAVVVLFLLLLLPLIGLAWLVIPTLAEQASAVTARLPDMVPRVQGWLERWGRTGASSLLDGLSAEVAQLSGRLLRVPLGLVRGLAELLLVLFIALYALMEGPALRSFVVSLVPGDRRARLVEILGATMQAMGGYVRVTALSGAVVGLLTYSGLLIIGVDYALVLALLAGVLEVVPVIGPIVAAVPMLAVALLESPTQALAVLVFVTVLQQVEAHVLLPSIMRTQTKVSPLLVLVALLAGSAVGGLLGAVVAIPLAAALRVLTREILAPAVRAQTGASEPDVDGSVDQGG